MYCYYRDNSNVLPMQNTGMMPTQNTGMMPMQNTNMLPVQNAYNPMAAMPVQNAYNPMNMPVQNTQNQAATLPAQYNQFAEMPTEDLESLYPQTYNKIQPVVENACESWMGKHGEQCPSKEDYDAMVSDVYNKVEADVETAVKNSPVAEERQFFGGGRRVLRDFIGTLIIANLIRRRRRPFFGGFGFPYGGFYGGYPFY